MFTAGVFLSSSVDSLRDLKKKYMSLKHSQWDLNLQCYSLLIHLVIRKYLFCIPDDSILSMDINKYLITLSTRVLQTLFVYSLALFNYQYLSPRY